MSSRHWFTSLHPEVVGSALAPAALRPARAVQARKGRPARGHPHSFRPLNAGGVVAARQPLPTNSGGTGRRPVHPDVVGRGGACRAAAGPRRSGAEGSASSRPPTLVPPAARGRGHRSAMSLPTTSGRTPSTSMHPEAAAIEVAPAAPQQPAVGTARWRRQVSPYARSQSISANSQPTSWPRFSLRKYLCRSISLISSVDRCMVMHSVDFEPRVGR